MNCIKLLEPLLARNGNLLRPSSSSNLNFLPQIKHFSRHNEKPTKTAILMLNMGGPQKQEDVHDFLFRLFEDKDIIKLPFQSLLGPLIAKRRTPAIKAKYQEIGGGSPIFKWTDLQGRLLCENLDNLCPDSAPHRHYPCFRYANPLTETVLEYLESQEIDHCIAFSQYPQYSCSTTGSSLNAIKKFYDDRGFGSKMKWTFIDRWGTNPYLAKCFADNIKSELQLFPVEIRDHVTILFSAHSLPMRQVLCGDPYPAEVAGTVSAVMQEAKIKNPYRLVWQSQVGPSQWLGPATDDAIRGLIKNNRKNMMLVPIAFVNEHIETLHEMDIEFIEDIGKKLGAERIARCQAPNDHPMFIKALVYEVMEHLRTFHKCSEQMLHTCPLCQNLSCYESKKWFRNLTQKVE